MIYAGQLTEKLDFYKIVETQTASGFKNVVEQYLFTTKAYRMKNKENYVVDAGEVFHSNELTFKMRIRNIDETCIVVYEGDRYHITSLNKYLPENQLTIMLSKINE